MTGSRGHVVPGRKIYLLQFSGQIAIVISRYIGVQTARPESLKKMGLPEIAEVVINSPDFIPTGNRPKVADQRHKESEAAKNLQIVHRFVPAHGALTGLSPNPGKPARGLNARLQSALGLR